MEFASGISVTCFAASYGLGLLFELARLYWSGKTMRWLATTAALAGLLAQTLFLAAIAVNEGRLPIATRFESLIALSWLVTLVYLYLLLRDRRLGAGLFVLPISLGLVLYAAFVADRPTEAREDVGALIGAAHGMLLLAGTVMVTVALAAALMYLVKIRQLRAGLSDRLRLPSLERLERLNAVAVMVAWPLLTIGLGLGLAMRQLSYSDPKVLTTFIAWILFTYLAHQRTQPANRGRRIAVLTVVACAVVLFSVLGDPIFGTSHQSSRLAP